MVPFKTQLLGGKRVKSVSMLYEITYSSFMLFISRLILLVIPRISRIKKKIECFTNNNLLFFSFNCGPIENVYYMKIIKYFMKRYRKVMNANSLCRVYLCTFGIDREVSLKIDFVYKQLTARRVPVFF